MKDVKLRLLFIVAAFTFVAFSDAQVSIQMSSQTSSQYAKMRQQRYVGDSHLLVVYEHTVYDPAVKQTLSTREVLQIGDTMSVSSDYGWYQVDSVVNLGDRHRVTNGAMNELVAKYQPNKQFLISKNYRTATLAEHGAIFVDNFVYYEPIPAFDWTILDDTTYVLNYVCRKATASFRGRQWTVYYADSLHYSEGPWKFCGLTGVVLRAESHDGEHRFEAISVNKNPQKMMVDVRRRDIVTTREKYFRTLAEYKRDVQRYLSQQRPDMFESSSVIPSNRLFNNPPEK